MRTDSNPRFDFIDLIRGMAVILMIFFHFFYDLNLYKVVKIDFHRDPFWFYLPRLIVTLFLTAVGMSLALVHKGKVNRPSFFKRLLKIGLCAALISLFTYFAFPKNWVYFGTLHCIFFITLFITPLLSLKWIPLFLGIGILIFHNFILPIPFLSMRHAAMDYIPLFPWIGVSLIGIFLTKVGIHRLEVPNSLLIQPLRYLGRHALMIYIIHQPILYALAFVISKSI